MFNYNIFLCFPLVAVVFNLPKMYYKDFFVCLWKHLKKGSSFLKTSLYVVKAKKNNDCIVIL